MTNQSEQDRILARVSDFLEANYSTEDMPDILPAVLAALEKAGAL